MTDINGEATVKIVGDVSMRGLARDLAFQWKKEQVLDFIMEIDGHVAEEEFTLALIKRLRESLSEDLPPGTITGMQDMRHALNCAMTHLNDLEYSFNMHETRNK